MSENTPTISPDTDNLADFEMLFAGKAQAAPHQTEEPVEPTNEVQEEGPEQVEPLAPEETDEPEATEEEKPKGKKKSNVQERFDEITAARREAERERDELRRMLEEERGRKKEPEAPTPEPIPQVADGPTPDDVNEDGSAKYPLGEFDPGFIRDLTRFTINQEREADRIASEQAEAQRQAETAKTELTAQWQEKVETALERIPDLREAGVVLDEAFDNIDPKYGEYLANTIMTLDHGPDVLYYLANNLEEAQRIANAGPVQATIALGRIEARFEAAQEKAKPKVSNAPEPPPVRARGTSGKFSVADDTDDLDAFERKFFGK